MKSDLGRHTRLIGGALALMLVGALLLTPAGAHVTGNFKHMWNDHFKDLAKKDFYTKALADAKFLGKGQKAANSAKLQGRRANTFMDRGPDIALVQNGTWNTNPDVELDQGTVGVSSNVTTITSQTGGNGMWSQLNLVAPLQIGSDFYALLRVDMCLKVGAAEDPVTDVVLIDQGADTQVRYTDTTDRSNTTKVCITIAPPEPIEFVSSPMVQLKQAVDDTGDTLSLYYLSTTWGVAAPD